MSVRVQQTLSPERLRAESRVRIDAALRRIEAAQNELNSACADLSTLYGCVPVWEASGKLADKVKALWYRVDKIRSGGKFRLDDFHVQCIVERETNREQSKGD